HEPLLSWSWLKSYLGSYSLTIARNAWRSFRLAYTRIAQSMKSFDRVFAPQLTVTRHKALVSALVVLASFLVMFGSIWIGLRGSRAGFGDTGAKERIEKNGDANKNTPKAKTPRDNRNKNFRGSVSAKKCEYREPASIASIGLTFGRKFSSINYSY